VFGEVEPGVRSGADEKKKTSQISPGSHFRYPPPPPHTPPHSFFPPAPPMHVVVPAKSHAGFVPSVPAWLLPVPVLGHYVLLNPRVWVDAEGVSVLRIHRGSVATCRAQVLDRCRRTFQCKCLSTWTVFSINSYPLFFFLSLIFAYRRSDQTYRRYFPRGAGGHVVCFLA
jgi:hypothetical protein